MTDFVYERPAPARHRALTTSEQRFDREFDELVRRDNGWTPKHRGTPNTARDRHDRRVLNNIAGLNSLLGRPALEKD